MNESKTVDGFDNPSVESRRALVGPVTFDQTSLLHPTSSLSNP